MKKIKLYIFIFLTHSAFSQRVISEGEVYLIVRDSTFKKFDKLKPYLNSNFCDDEWELYSDLVNQEHNKSNGCIKVDSLIPLLEGDVFNYYSLTGYSTPLQRKVFRESPLYQDYKNELDSLKSSALKVFYSTSIGGSKINISDYDLVTKSFRVRFDNENSILNKSGSNATLVNVWELNELPFKYDDRKSDLGDMKCHHVRRELILSVDEPNALRIEKNRNEIELIMIYSIGNLSSVEEGKVCYVKNQYVVRKTIIPCFVRLLLVNSNDHSIYFSKSFYTSSEIPSHFTNKTFKYSSVLRLESNPQAEVKELKENQRATGGGVPLSLKSNYWRIKNIRELEGEFSFFKHSMPIEIYFGVDEYGEVTSILEIKSKGTFKASEQEFYKVLKDIVFQSKNRFGEEEVVVLTIP